MRSRHVGGDQIFMDFQETYNSVRIEVLCDNRFGRGVEARAAFYNVFNL